MQILLFFTPAFFVYSPGGIEPHFELCVFTDTIKMNIILLHLARISGLSSGLSIPRCGVTGENFVKGTFQLAKWTACPAWYFIGRYSGLTAPFGRTQKATLQLWEKPVSVSVTRDGSTAAASPNGCFFPEKALVRGWWGRQSGSLHIHVGCFL